VAAERARHVAFRVDSGTQLASGHLARCLTLARELALRGVRVEFLCRDLPGHLGARVTRAGYPVHLIPAAAAEPAASSVLLTRLGAEVLVVDHYGLDAAWERAQRAAVGRILAIDDVGRDHDCEVLLDQNFFGPVTSARYAGRLPAHASALLGPHFALLGREYAAARRTTVPRAGGARRVLIFYGASDVTDETSKALRALSSGELARLEVDVVVGPNHPGAAVVGALADARPRTTLHHELPSLAPLIAAADLVVGAGGATTLERLCLGRRSVVVTVAENQEPSTASLDQAGLLRWVGRAPSVSVEALREAILAELEAPRTTPGPELVDGYGAPRVAAALAAPRPAELRLQRAERADAGLLFLWRNEPLARAMSFDDAPISWERHLTWLERKLADRDVLLFIAFADGLPVGQLRLELTGEEAELSYAVDPQLRGLGFGTALVEQAIRQLGAPPPGGVRARVKAANTASRRIFEHCGWRADVTGADYTYRLGGRDR